MIGTTFLIFYPQRRINIDKERKKQLGQFSFIFEGDKIPLFFFFVFFVVYTSK